MCTTHRTVVPSFASPRLAPHRKKNNSLASRDDVKGVRCGNFVDIRYTYIYQSCQFRLWVGVVRGVKWVGGYLRLVGWLASEEFFLGKYDGVMLNFGSVDERCSYPILK